MSKPIACIHPDTLELLKHGRYEDTKHVAVHRRSELCETSGHVALYDDANARIAELTAGVAKYKEAIRTTDVYIAMLESYTEAEAEYKDYPNHGTKDDLDEARESLEAAMDAKNIARNALKEG